ncbi:hypothetical protein FHS75_003178 [Novosphingobium marinum]|uniref:Uncharacterized protein n=1 Tax=Novosphingobium marinum TaxID=1514948 RepID=A0A7Y9XYD7_9SPHN|nr:hypothetical protein [Novosphingobium marinum]
MKEARIVVPLTEIESTETGIELLVRGTGGRTKPVVN